MLKCIGKFIDESGLDQLFIESEIYGPNTLEHIKSGKHMKRAIEAYQTLYLALSDSYFKNFLHKYPEIQDDLFSQIASHTIDYQNVKLQQKEELQLSFDSTLSQQSKFLRNYVKIFESLIVFIRATRQGLWESHLSSLHNLTK